MLATPLAPRVMPTRHPRIAHFVGRVLGYLLGDSLRAIAMAKRLGFRFIDQNGHSDAQAIVWVIHWGDLRDFGWEWTGKYDAKGREIRRFVGKRRIDKMTTEQVRRRRSRRYGGIRPHAAEAHMREAKRVGIVWCLEAKGNPLFLTDAPWEYLNGAARRTRVVMVVMTLQDLPGAAGRLRMALKHGFAAALLPRGPRPPWWTELRDQGVQLWGRWRSA